MSVRNDRWIIEQAKKGMISPFEEKQVSKGVISFGVSSYGYDMRVADEFKIFTNVNCTIVDPKNFTDKNYVDFKGDVCIIPPNSFALARSMEYFRIPRDVLAICLGKSTYARCGIVVNITPLEPCYDKETELLTLDGWKRFKDIKDDEIVATLSEQGEIEYQRIIRRQKFRFKDKLIQIRGRNVDLAVTPAHQLFVRKKGSDTFEFIRADEIYGKYNYEFKRDAIWKGQKKDYFILPPVMKSLRFSIYYKIRQEIIDLLKEGELNSKELYSNIQTKISYREFAKILSDLYEQDVLERRVMYAKRNIGANKIYVWSLKDINYADSDCYSEPVKIPMDDWLRFFGIWIAEGSACVSKKGYHVKVAAFGKNKKIIEGWIKKLPFRYYITDTGFQIESKQLCLYLLRFGHASEKFVPPEIKSLPPKQIKIFLDAYMMGDGNEQTLTYTTTSKKLADDIQELVLKAGWASTVRRIPKEKMPMRRLGQHIIKYNYDIYKIRISKKQLTPKIYKRSFSKIDYDDYVYDVTVPNHTLYVRRNGKACWSSNCWEGYVTIEISNTTPLPAKIYSNEGIAQVIFLSAEEECLISYKDKKGRYQKQTGIEPPKMI
ncbi:MAG: dCTP deaminase [Deltaproteobacteria bacterium]|nr:dCTP deaminase [Deltaproteobacteria bacterium]